MKWRVVYVVGVRVPWYKSKIVTADNAEQAIKRARVKNIVDLFPIE